jgi:hypothetical protein
MSAAAIVGVTFAVIVSVAAAAGVTVLYFRRKQWKQWQRAGLAKWFRAKAFLAKLFFAKSADSARLDRDLVPGDVPDPVGAEPVDYGTMPVYMPVNTTSVAPASALPTPRTATPPASLPVQPQPVGTMDDLQAALAAALAAQPASIPDIVSAPGFDPIV